MHWCTGALFDILKRLTRLTGIVDTFPEKVDDILADFYLFSYLCRHLTENKDRMIMSKISFRFYKDHEVRAIWDEENSKWWFSVQDVTTQLSSTVGSEVLKLIRR